MASLYNKRHGISIHSPRMGRDAVVATWAALYEDFNPLSPHGERLVKSQGPITIADFNPLSPHGERRVFAEPILYPAISIHSPRMGRDPSRVPW